MNVSDYLKAEIEKKIRKLLMLRSYAWKDYNEEVLDKLEFEAFTKWQTVPAEETAQVLELQLAAKMVASVRQWGDAEALQSELITQQDHLREIEDGKASDEWVNDSPPVQSKLEKLREMIKKFTDLPRGGPRS